MKINTKLRHLAVAGVAVAVAAFASGAQAALLRVIVVKTDNVSAYTAELKKGQALLKRLGSPAQLRVWRGRFAGENAGRVVVTVEYPSLLVFAQDDAKAMADAEYAAWLKGLDKVRTIVSDSTYDELK